MFVIQVKEFEISSVIRGFCGLTVDLSEFLNEPSFPGQMAAFYVLIGGISLNFTWMVKKYMLQRIRYLPGDHGIELIKQINLYNDDFCQLHTSIFYSV